MTAVIYLVLYTLTATPTRNFQVCYTTAAAAAAAAPAAATTTVTTTGMTAVATVNILQTTYDNTCALDE